MSVIERTDVIVARQKLAIAPAFEQFGLWYVVALPLMYVIGFYVHMKKIFFGLLGAPVHTNCFVVDGISINSRRMKEGAARWPALNTCYNFVRGEGPTQLHRVVDWAWMHIRNAQAVRNRLKIAKKQLRNAIKMHGIDKRPIRILSLAAGTAQGVIEVAARMQKLGYEFEILLIDQDDTALHYARQFAQKHGVVIQTIQGDVLFFNRYLDGFKPDIIEMMGLLDYLPNGLAVKLISKIRRHLPDKGHFFTCHIHPNGERYFLKHVVDWDMLYRSQDELKSLLIDAGFLNPALHTEPHGIHSIAIAQKL